MSAALIPLPARVSIDAVHANASRSKARPGILHGTGQQRPHAQGIYERDAMRCRVVRGARYRLGDVQPFHVAAFVKELQREFSHPLRSARDRASRPSRAPRIPSRR